MRFELPRVFDTKAIKIHSIISILPNEIRVAPAINAVNNKRTHTGIFAKFGV